FLLQSRMFETGSILHDHLNNHVREVSLITQRDITLDQLSRAILFGHNQETRKTRASRFGTRRDARNLQWRFRLNVLRDQDKYTRLQERRVECSQTLVVIVGISSKVISDKLAVTGIGN